MDENQAKSKMQQLTHQFDAKYTTSTPIKSNITNPDEPTELSADFYRTIADVPNRDKEQLCPTCHTPADVGKMRINVPVGDPKFGKLVNCPDSFHQDVREQRLAELSRMGVEDVKWRLTDIKATTFNREMIEACRAIIDRGYGWLYLHGGPGNAKTLALKAIVNEMNEKGTFAQFTTMHQIVIWMRAAFKKDASEGELERYNRLIEVPVLSVDEVGWTKETDWLVEFRANFLNDRYEKNIMNRRGITVFSSNPHPRVLFENADPFKALFDRFDDGRCLIVENRQPSTRPKAGW